MEMTYVSIAVVKTEGQSTGCDLGFDNIGFSLAPWHGYDFGVIFPWFLSKDRCHKEAHI
jgi:hypothetical protein